MNAFERYIYEEIRQAIDAIGENMIDSIYVMSFFIYDDEDDSRNPTLMFGYNTVERWRECTPADGSKAGWPIASDTYEAKWNYAFWLQNNEAIIGEAGTEGERLRQKWIESLNLAYSEEEKEEDFDRCMELGEQIKKQFVSLCVRVAKMLHDNGVIAHRFGKPIPIIVHELDYNDLIAEQTRKANPPGLTEEFESWVKGLGA